MTEKRSPHGTHSQEGTETTPGSGPDSDLEAALVEAFYQPPPTFAEDALGQAMADPDLSAIAPLDPSPHRPLRPIDPSRAAP